MYTLTAGVSAAGGGTVSMSPNLAKHDSGTTVSVTATPDSGYTFAGWAGSVSGTANPAFVIMDGNKELTANFQEITPDAKYKLTVSISPAGGGTVSASPDSAEYALGTPVTVSAVPADGYTFTGWSGGATGTANPVTVVMNGDKAVTANFQTSAVNPVGPGSWDPVWACPAGVSDTLDLNMDNLGIDSDYVVIKFKNGAAPEVTYSDDMGNTHTVNGEHVTLNMSHFYSNNSRLYNIILAGTAQNGSLTVNADPGYRTTLYLNGADITNLSGPAVNIQVGKRTDVHLVGSCDKRNKLNGKGNDTPEGAPQAKGAFFSEGALVFSGSGSLEVRSADKHAVVSDEFIEIESGNIIIYESKSDGIHANERITIKGGKLQIKCEGDAIQNERRTAGKSELCPITVSGGKITIRTTGPKGHGIVSDSNDVVISGDATDINITLTGNGSKGIRSHGSVKIGGGAIYLEAYGARESLTNDTSSAAGIKADADVEISRGIITIKSERANENGKGLNIDGNLTITGGTTKITSDGDGVKAAGSVNMSAGTLEVKSANKQDIDCGGKVNKTGGTLKADNIKQGV
jgi:uncharacterized repeat protein (TIGR02543 family)